LERRGRSIILKTLTQYSPDRTAENHENLSQDTRFPGRDLNQRPPQYKAGVLTTLPRLPVRIMVTTTNKTEQKEEQIILMTMKKKYSY
jgi:hypothetical protein